MKNKDKIIYSLIVGGMATIGLVIIYLLGAFFSDSSLGEVILFNKKPEKQEVKIANDKIKKDITKTAVMKNEKIESDFKKKINIQEKNFLKLSPPTDDKIYFGAFSDFGGPEDYVTAGKVEKFNKLVGKKIFWAYFSNNWGREGVKFPRQKVEAIASVGAVPFVRMMPRKILDTPYDKTYSFQKIIDGKFDKELHQYAKDVKDYGEMVLMDYGLEMNGNWFPWSGVMNGGGVKTKYGSPEKADGPERFIDAYHHIVDIFREEKVKNVTWFFHPDVYSEPNAKWNQPKEYYPGDDYVDWIGISAYGPQNPAEDYWDTFPEIMKETQKGILAITKNKPVALLEFGVTDHHPLGKKSVWLAGAFRYILDKNSPLQFKAISPWHENWEEDDNLWATLRLDSSGSALATFKKMIADERFVGGKYLEGEKNLQDKCDIGVSVVPENERNKFNCEKLIGCQWKNLGGKLVAQYACCPKDLDLNSNDENFLKIYQRCFMIVD